MAWSRLVRALTVGALVGSAVLIWILAAKERALSKAYTELRLASMVTRPGDFVPRFDARTTAGDSIVLGEGPPSTRQLLFILTKSCPFCRRTLPSWRSVSDKLAGERPGRVQVMAIALDSVRETAAYLRVHGINAAVTEFPSHRMKRLYRAVVVPQTIVLDDSGRVLYSRAGVIEGAAAVDSIFRAAVRPLLRVPTKTADSADTNSTRRVASPR